MRLSEGTWKGKSVVMMMEGQNKGAQMANWPEYLIWKMLEDE
jgi:hypothetical protein